MNPNEHQYLISSMPFFWIPLLLLYPLFTFAQSDEFLYTGFHGAGNNISLDGIATIKPNGIIQLTNTTSGSIGRAMYTTPLQFKNSTNGKSFSFSTSFAFAIVPQYPKLGGHGFAFTISPTKDLEGALPSQYLGLLNPNNTGNSSNHLFAVEFDTVQNFEFNDINGNHVGIDINSLVSNASVSAGLFTANSTQGLNLKSGRVIQAWVDYDSSKKLVNVFISPSSSKPRLPILSSHIDLSPILQNSMYIGFSSSTGLLASYHYILGWSFKMNGIASTLQIASLPSLPGSRKENRALTIGLSVAAVMVMMIVVIVAIYLIRKLRNADPIEEWELNFGPHRFSYQELKIATKGFREKQLLGFGGFGRVYKGVLPNSKIEIAVKRISHESKQGLREFMSEIGSIGRLRHRNLVQLQGWCRRRGDLLLVYEFMPNGSLDKYIYDEPESILSWEQRFKIIRGVASALLYLHEEWEQIVIHRDVKASNVLLDAELNGRLGDFGLARLYDHGTNPTTTRVVGTLGYLAPELTRTGKSSTCSDVFSFGALLLEITCGRKPVEPKALPEDLILVDWVRDKWREGKALDVVDKRMDCYDVEEVVMVLKLGLMCSSNAPSARPSMRQVVSWLEGEVKVPEVLNSPAAYEAAKNVGEEFDDFVHSYPSSSFEKASVVGDDDLEAGIGSSLNKS